MKNRRKNNRVNRNSGFTMVETLATVAIIVILLAVSAVAVIRYIDYLKLTELDNAAREIYMAAQNRAVLLSGNQQLADMVYVEKNGVKTEGCGTFVTLDDGKYHGGNVTEVVSRLDTVDIDEDDVVYVHISDFYFWDDEDNKYKYKYELLDTGNIDPTLLEKGDFYIVYDLDRDSATGNVVTGSVTDVIYAERSKDGSYLLQDVTANSDYFKENYETWWIDDHSGRIKKTREGDEYPLVGWYNGKAAESSEQPVSPDGQPVIVVDIKNGEELTVTVSVYYGKDNKVTDEKVQNEIRDVLKNGKLSVILSDVNGDHEGINLMTDVDEGRISGNGFNTDNPDESTSYSYTWLLDSLTAEGENGKYNFQSLDIYKKTGVELGDNFKVTASIPEVRSILRAQSSSDVDSSLFAKESEPEKGIARIAYLRHLQNLDAQGGYNSGVTNIIKTAEQTRDIFGEGNEILEDGERIYADYKFISIDNPNLESYNGYNDVVYSDAAQGNVELYGYEIRNLTVKTDVAGKTSFGLFSKTPENGMKFSNIRLVNTVVKAAAANTSVGALAGTVTGTTTIDNCWVYWEVGLGVGSLQTELGTDENGISGYEYQLVGNTVGGLVGTFTTIGDENAEITNSLAATMISGTSAAGGLVGEVKGSTGLTIEHSYADCYLTGKNAAGLIGNVGYDANAGVTLTDCYAAGFVLYVDNTGFMAAGLCLGTGSTTANNVYSAMRYLKANGDNVVDVTENGNGNGIYGLARNLSESGSSNYWFWGKGTGAGHFKSYNEMANNGTSTIAATDFAYTMNDGSETGPFVWRPDTSAYNLRTNMKLVIYSLPGLKNMPHYGDWGARFKEPSLVYYEHYANASGTNAWGISGGNERNLLGDVNNLKDGEITDPDFRTVLSDGYAVAFLVSDVTTTGVKNVTIKYRYLNDKSDEVEGSIPVSVADLVSNNQGTEWDDDESSSGKQQAYLIPLPDKLVYNSHDQDSFYHYFEFELYYDQTDDTGELVDEAEYNADGEYFFNPHFAEAVKFYSGKTKNPTDWSEVEDDAKKLAEKMGQVSVRTPRHLYDLSLFDKYYSYAFRQYLDLDYSTYNWMGMDKDNKKSIFEWTEGKKDLVNSGDGKLITVPYAQKPIGSQTQSFQGSYNGGYHLIKNVKPDMGAISAVNRYAGLFGNFWGTKLENIVYQMGPDVYMDTAKTINDSTYDNYRLDIEKSDIAQGMYIGGLVGFNNGEINNCAVYGVDVKMTVTGIRAYVGGLVGRNEGTITNCSAESNALTVDGSNSAHIYAGGFVGENCNNSTINFAYAVGRINGGAKNSDTLLCGFAGKNSGFISNAYATVDLEPSGGAKAYGFCDESGFKSENGINMTDNIGYLDDENYTYRKSSYAAKYAKKDIDDAFACAYDGSDGLYAKLTKELSSESDMGKAVYSVQRGGNDIKYPFPAVVRAKDGDFIHYGLWVTRMNLGQMGVFYWEKLQDVETSDSSYHIYALAVDSTGKTITEQDTLSKAYDDGKAVTEYGYGYYFETDKVEKFDFKANNIYKKVGESTQEIINSTYNKNEENGKISVSNGYKAKDDEPERNDKLNELMDGNYTFSSWKSYYKGNLSQAVPGLILDVQNGSLNGGTFTLSQKDENGNDIISVDFIINPHFAASISVPSLPEGYGYTPDDSKYYRFGELNKPGSLSNPFQVRSGRQLQNINWMIGDQTNACLSETDGIGKFPYLWDGKTNTEQYYWEQTHDLDWMAEGNYYVDGNKRLPVFFTPIAGNTVSSTDLSLYGSFGGTYRGNNYTMKNFKIGVGEGYELNCIGLFGSVDRATLENIVLYSEDPVTGTLTVNGRKATNDQEEDPTDGDQEEDQPDNGQKVTVKNLECWYAGGVLAGVAQNSMITDCAVAGYTIEDRTKFARERKTSESVYEYYWEVTIGLPDEITPIPPDKDTARVVIYSNIYYDNGEIVGELFTSDGTTLPARNGGNVYYFKYGDKWYAFNYNGTKANNIFPVNDVGEIGKTFGKARDADGNPKKEYVEISNKTTYDMGGAIGGLVGMVSNTPVSSCAAVVNIKLDGDHSAGGGEAPIRVGGLVGSTTSNIVNCYTGDNGDTDGKIQCTSTGTVKYYIGRIIGGVGIEPLEDEKTDEETGDSASVENCYSYMNIPSSTSDQIGALYNIGGTEVTDNTVSLDNNYYLSDATGPGNDNNVDNPGEVTGIVYNQLANKETIVGGQNIYRLLNGNDSRSPYDEVAKSVAGDSPATSSGRYTFVPASNRGLLGLDYPFPTILTREGKHVHYGAWTLYGIKRYMKKNGDEFTDERGGEPVELNLFAKEDGQNEFGVHQEYLKLAENVNAGGTWSYKISGDGGDYIDVQLGKEEDDTAGSDWNTLRIIAKKTSDTPVTVTIEYKYTDPEGATLTYPLNINVYVIADVDLEPTKLSMFPSDNITVYLEPDSIEGSLGNYDLTIESAKSTNNAYLTPTVVNKNGLMLKTNASARGTVYVDVIYKYTPRGQSTEELEEELDRSVEGKKRIEVTMLPMPDQLWTINGDNWNWTMDFSNVDIVDSLEVSDNSLPGWLKPQQDTADNKKIVVSKVDTEETGESEIQDEEDEWTVTVHVTENLPEESENGSEESVVGLVHTLTITVPKPVSSTDLELKIEQKKSTENGEDEKYEWTIDFGEYGVSEPKLETDSGFTADLSEDGTVVIRRDGPPDNSSNCVSLDVMLTESVTKLRENIRLNILLPELTAELYSVYYDDNAPIYSWIIDLGENNSKRIKDSMTLEVSEGYRAEYSEDMKSVIITADPTGGEGATGEPIKLTVTLTPDGSPTEIYTLTVNLSSPDKPDNTEGMELKMLPGDTVELERDTIFADVTDVDLNTISIKKVTSNNENVEATLNENGVVELKNKSLAGNTGEAYVGVVYTYRSGDATFTGTKKIAVTLLPLPQGMWNAATDDDSPWTWTISFSDDALGYSVNNIGDASAVNAEGNNIEAVVENGDKIILKPSPYQESTIKLTFTAIDSSGYSHSVEVEITVPRPRTEDELTLNVNQVQDGWEIGFSGYEFVVVDDGTAGEGMTRIANETTGNMDVSFVIQDTDDVNRQLTVILSSGGLLQKITLQIVLPKLEATLNVSADGTESHSHSWNIDLNRYKELVKSVVLTDGAEEGFIVTPIPDGDVSPGDATVSIGSYNLEYTGGDGVPENVKLGITIITETGMTEKCTLTIPLDQIAVSYSGDNTRSVESSVSDGDAYSDDSGISEDSGDGSNSVTASATLDAYLTDNQNEDEYSDEEESEEEFEEESEEEPADAADQPESEQMPE